MKVRMLALLARVGTALACTAVMSCGGGGDASVPPGPSVTLFAGALQSGGNRDAAGSAAQFNRPADVAQDATGNVYVADTGNHTIRKISTDGSVTTFAGAAGQAGSADGAGAGARFAGPWGVAVDAAGNVLVSDTGNSTLRKISSAGVVTTIAGVAGQAAIVDGDAATARLRGPESLALDAAGNIYFVDGFSVRKRAPDGSITTFAGNATERSFASGNGAKTRFIGPLLSVAVDGSANVYVAQSGSLGDDRVGDIRKFDSQGGALAFGAAANGVLPAPYPVDIAADAAGNVYVVSNGFDQPSPHFLTTYRSVTRFTTDGMSSTLLAGGNNDSRIADGPIASARFMDPRAVAVGPNGRIVVAETSSNAIRLIDTQQGAVTTLAGGSGGGDVDGAAASARFNEPLGMAANADGTLYVADSRNHSVRKINTAGVVSTLARGFRFPQNMATGPNGGTVYMVDSVIDIVGRLITAIAPDGSASTFGSIAPGFGFTSPSSTAALAVDAAGNLYISENRDVVVIAPSGIRRILATGIAASNLAVDAAGSVYFTSSHNTVGVIDPSGQAVIRAGRPDEPGDADGVGQEARFRAPNALALDPNGNMYVGDGTKIRRITPEGTVTTIADAALVQGAQAGFTATSITAVRGLAWSAGALYASVLNAVLRITL